VQTEDQILVDAICGADAKPGSAQRRAMAKAITLLESTRPDHRLRADEVLNLLDWVFLVFRGLVNLLSLKFWACTLSAKAIV
jgi:hypothetical protein